MARVKRGVTSHAKHKKVFKAAKGYYGRRKNTIRIAKQAVEKAQQYAYRDRKVRKRNFRALWIQRINAAVREFGLTYGRFIDGLNKAGIEVDRKVLSDMAIHEPEAFGALVAAAKKRFKITATGKVKSAAAGKRHGMIKRSNKFIRDARGTMVLAEPDGKKIIKNFLPNGGGI
jgi:large subunit ribosomal protein L20